MLDDYPAPDNKAYAQGGAANEAGVTLGQNPHPRYSHSWEQWRLGWLRNMVQANEAAAPPKRRRL